MSRARVITERDVRRAAKDGTRELDAAGAVVTPSASDVAARLGVTLQGSKSTTESTATTAAAVAPKDLGHTVTDFGTTGSAAVDYPDYAIAVARGSEWISAIGHHGRWR